MIHNACCCGGGAARKTTLAELKEGAVIRLTENDSFTPFIVAKHNYESGLNGTGRTLVVRKYGYGSVQWGSSYNFYASSVIDELLNSDYKASLDSGIQSAIGTTKFRYTPGNGDDTVRTLSRPIFLLSLTELGFSSSYFNKEGSALSIASSLRIAYVGVDRTPINWWTRSPRKNTTQNVFCILSNGDFADYACNVTRAVRPALTLPSTIDVTELGIII